ncbi:MAG TPA: alpha/beta hydrolase [Anaeromyxobacteraceae bacterium]|nr:alpha/beta hydrolase [Anaeromyxobacteraceae bacterium]
MEEIRFRANGVPFFALAEGPPQGRLVLLLHGFPELSLSWRRQLPALAAAGFRAVAPDLRGYGRSGGREGPFDLRTLAADVAGMVGALGRERAAVVGHDWGGAAAWATAGYRPEVVERLVVMNSPHPSVLKRELVRNPRQLLRSWYMFLFQIPRLPEWLLTRNGAAEVGRMLRGGSHRRDAFPWEETAPYREAFLQPGAARAALGYYRAAFFRRAAGGPRPRPIRAPAMILWGARDRFLGRETIEPAKMARLFAGAGPEISFVEGAGHYVQNEAPEAVNAALVAFLSRPS